MSGPGSTKSGSPFLRVRACRIACAFCCSYQGSTKRRWQGIEPGSCWWQPVEEEERLVGLRLAVYASLWDPWVTVAELRPLVGSLCLRPREERREPLWGRLVG